MQIAGQNAEGAHGAAGTAFGRLVRLMRKAYGREIPADATVWHPVSLWIPVRGWHWEVWRRRNAAGRWEYKARTESETQSNERQW